MNNLKCYNFLWASCLREWQNGILWPRFHLVLPLPSINQQVSVFTEWLVWAQVRKLWSERATSLPDGLTLSLVKWVDTGWAQLKENCSLNPCGVWLSLSHHDRLWGSEVGIFCGMRTHYPFESWLRLLCLDVGSGRTKHAGKMRDFLVLLSEILCLENCYWPDWGAWKVKLSCWNAGVNKYLFRWTYPSFYERTFSPPPKAIEDS